MRRSFLSPPLRRLLTKWMVGFFRKAVGVVWSSTQPEAELPLPEPHSKAENSPTNPNGSTVNGDPGRKAKQQAVGAANAPQEIDWSLVAQSIRRRQWVEAVNILSLDAALKRTLADPSLGETMQERLAATVTLRYFAAVREQSPQAAARFAVLYSLVGSDISRALEFLHQQILETLQRDASRMRDQLRRTLAPAAAEGPKLGGAAGSAGKSLASSSAADDEQQQQLQTISVLVGDTLTVSVAIGRAFESVVKILQQHAYADQAFSPVSSLSLLKHLQPFLDATASEYFSMFLASWQWDRLEVDLRRGRFRVQDAARPDTSRSFADMLDEYCSVFHRVESYKWYLRNRYESGVAALQERGWTFFNEPGAPDRVGRKELNILNYIVEPKSIYGLVDDSQSVYIALERSWLIAELQRAWETDGSHGQEQVDSDVHEAVGGVSAAVDASFLILQRTSERAFLCCSSKIAEALFSDFLVRGFQCLVAILTQRVQKVLPVVPSTKGAFQAHAPSVSMLFKSTMARVAKVAGNAGASSQEAHRAVRHIIPATSELGQALNDAIFASQYADKFHAVLADLLKAAVKNGVPDFAELISTCVPLWHTKSSSMVREFLQHTWESVFDSFQWSEHISQALSAMRSSRYDVTLLAAEPVWPNFFLSQFKEQVWESAKHLCLDSTSAALLEHGVTLVCSLIEEIIASKRFTYLGALQLDSDVRRLFILLSELSKHPLRPCFARLRQITSLLSLESLPEVLEMWNMPEDSTPAVLGVDGLLESPTPNLPPQSSKARTWKVSPIELKLFLKCRVDYSPAAVDKLQL